MLVYINASAQSATRLEAGIETAFPLYTSEGSNHTIGLGYFTTGERYFPSHFSLTASLSYISFYGKLVYWDNRVDHNFSQVPVTIGGRYYLKHFFAGFEAGVAFRTSLNANNNLLMAPLAGWYAGKWKLSARYTIIPGLSSIHENTFLQNGGYGYMNIGLSYPLF